MTPMKAGQFLKRFALELKTEWEELGNLNTRQMKNSMKAVKLMTFWEHAKDLNFGEICEVYDAAISAAEDKVFEIRKAKIIAAANEPQKEKP